MASDTKLAQHLKLVHIDLPDRVRALWRHDWDMYWYYVLWQRLLTKKAMDLHSAIRFDVLHHVTFANDWLPCGLASVPGVPLVWGPVGGASHIPYWKLKRWLGARGLATEIARDLMTSFPRRIWGDRTAQRAALVIAQNPDVAARFERFAPTTVQPNASLDPVTSDISSPPGQREVDNSKQKLAVFAGRLMGLKGVRLALDTIAHPLCQDWRLRIYGAGYDLKALRLRAQRLSIANRVEFVGHRPRSEVLAAFRQADALLFPSMHDQAGWVVAEASSLGCPVVCLPLGGPPLLAEPNGFVASLNGDIVANVANQLVAAGKARGQQHNLWTVDRLPALVSGWYDQVTATV